jgi:hypothetical protein
MVKECTSLLELASWEKPNLDGLVAEKEGGNDKTSAASQDNASCPCASQSGCGCAGCRQQGLELQVGRVFDWLKISDSVAPLLQNVPQWAWRGA